MQTRPVRRRVPVAPAATLVAGLGCAAVGGVQAGGRGAVSALLATAVVIGFLWSGAVPLLLARTSGGALTLLLLLLNYALRLLVALAVLRLAARAGWVLPPVLGLTVVVCALTWTGAQVVLLLRSEGTE